MPMPQGYVQSRLVWLVRSTYALADKVDAQDN